MLLVVDFSGGVMRSHFSSFVLHSYSISKTGIRFKYFKLHVKIARTATAGLRPINVNILLRAREVTRKPYIQNIAICQKEGVE